MATEALTMTFAFTTMTLSLALALAESMPDLWHSPRWCRPGCPQDNGTCRDGTGASDNPVALHWLAVPSAPPPPEGRNRRYGGHTKK
ncbi:hypothetical protein ACGFXB_36440 [Streptomyces canus]|uniref:hypothetical protein n=1 Tax=Streptomyces canus TaxID=58343 RepID=UPI003716FDD2